MADPIPQTPPRIVQKQLADAALTVIAAFCEMGRRCVVHLHDGSCALVANVAVGHDTDEPFAHITTNLGQIGVPDLQVHFIKLNQMIRVTCAQTGRVVLDLEAYEIG